MVDYDYLEDYQAPPLYDQHYTFHNQWFYPDGRHVENTSCTALRYVFPQEMEALLHYNGFQIRSCYGDWQQGPLTASSRYMIYVCQRCTSETGGH